MSKIFTIGTGKRFQFTQSDDGFWFQRQNRNEPPLPVRWGSWYPTGSRNRPPNVWYSPNAGIAKLPKEKEHGKDNQ